jgi:hypothetical protein
MDAQQKSPLRGFFVEFVACETFSKMKRSMTFLDRKTKVLLDTPGTGRLSVGILYFFCDNENEILKNSGSINRRLGYDNTCQSCRINTLG